MPAALCNTSEQRSNAPQGERCCRPCRHRNAYVITSPSTGVDAITDSYRSAARHQNGGRQGGGGEEGEGVGQGGGRHRGNGRAAAAHGGVLDAGLIFCESPLSLPRPGSHVLTSEEALSLFDKFHHVFHELPFSRLRGRVRPVGRHHHEFLSGHAFMDAPFRRNGVHHLELEHMNEYEQAVITES